MGCACKELKHVTDENKKQFQELKNDNNTLIAILKQFLSMIGSIVMRIIMCFVVIVLVIFVGVSIIVSSIFLGKPMVFLPKLNKILNKHLNGEELENKD